MSKKTRIVLYGTGECGIVAYEKLSEGYDIVAWGDSDEHKQGLFFYGLPILSIDGLVRRYLNSDVRIVVSIGDYYDVAKVLSEKGLGVIGFFSIGTNRILPWKKINWGDIRTKTPLRLYAGDLREDLLDKYPDRICLSITKNNYCSIMHDITKRIPLCDNTVESFQSEDVAEHIDIELQINILNEIYRVLKPGSVFRWSLPDYGCDYLRNRSFTDKYGHIVFDPFGGGRWNKGKTLEGGHVWFPDYETVKHIIECSKFSHYKFYRYYTEQGWHVESIDFDIGYVSRVRENDERGIDTSLVVDCYK